mmetsp:Transcript_17397/g.12432  ORF Transcript_17397/g.12432 Transcript_17397/m.12432 type:complete len:178 (+) Transcript_17397:190-723(+)
MDSISGNSYVLSLVFFSMSPILFSLFVGLLLLLLSICTSRKFKKKFFQSWITLSLTFVFILLPTITSYSFGMFNCQEVEGVSYLVRDFSLVCWSPDHRRSILLYALPSILVWTIGFPVAICVFLARNRRRLDEPEVIKKFGLYYVGLTDEKFYWQVIVVNFKRVIYIILTVSVLKVH